MKKAILVIDIQKDFTGEHAKMPVDKKQAIQMIDNVNRLIDNATAKNLLIVYIGNEYGKLNLLNIFRNFAAIKNTDGIQQDERLHIVNNHYFEKQKGNAFSNPALHTFLQKENIGELLIAGLYAEHCIYQTLKGALKNKYRTVLLTDCVASKSDNQLDAAIDKCMKLGVQKLESVEV